MSWTTIKLGDACDVIAGGTPARSVAAYWGGGVPWVKISDMLQRRITCTDETISEEGLNNSAAKLLPTGTLLISIFATIGRTAVLECDAATNQAIVGVIPKDPGTFDSRFLEYSLQQKAVELQCQGRGVAQANINGSMLKATTIPLPPLPEQKRIAGVLDAADASRAKRREALAQLDTLLQSTFLDMFGDPVTNPFGWEVRSMKQTRSKVQIGPFGSLLHKGDYLVGGVPIVNPMHMVAGRIQISEEQTVSEQKAETLACYRLAAGDVVMGRRGEMGRCAIVSSADAGMLCGTGSLYFRPDPNELLSPFFAAMLSSQPMKRHLEGLSQGVTMANLNRAMVEKMRIPLPPLDLQRRFAAFVESVEHQKARMRVHLTELDALFASLQSRAFNGEL